MTTSRPEPKRSRPSAAIAPVDVVAANHVLYF